MSSTTTILTEMSTIVLTLVSTKNGIDGVVFVAIRIESSRTTFRSIEELTTA